MSELCKDRAGCMGDGTALTLQNDVEVSKRTYINKRLLKTSVQCAGALEKADVRNYQTMD